jgi:hypothetical protein
MKFHMPLLYPVLMTCLMASGVIQAQTPMPQDNWSYYGKKLATPSTSFKGAVTIGSGGIYVGSGSGSTSPATSVQRYDANGAYLGSFSATFSNVCGLDCDSTGNVYVFDRPEIKVFSPDGTFLRKWGSLGTGPNQFAAYTHNVDTLAIDKNDRVYICDTLNHRVTVHDKLGNFLFQFGEQGTLPSQFNSYPTAISILGSNIAVNDRTPYRTLLFDTQGNYLRDTAVYGSIMIDSPDNLLFVRTNSYRGLTMLSANLETVGQIVLKNPTPGAPDIEVITGMDFDSHGNLVCVIETLGAGSGYPYNIFYYERRYRTTDNPLATNSLPQPFVSSVKQRPGTTEIEINYGVKDGNDATVETRLLAFKDGNTNFANIIPIRTYVGDTTGKVGASTTTNVEHQLVWNAAADWSEDFGQIKIEVLAKDTRGLLGMHWITIPANGDDPELVVGKTPVGPDDLFSVCYWLIAGGDPRVILENGTLKATGGTYAGQVIYTDSTLFSTAGRNFILRDILGMRPITTEEITRVYSGNFNLKEEMSNYVILLP